MVWKGRQIREKQIAELIEDCLRIAGGWREFIGAIGDGPGGPGHAPVVACCNGDAARSLNVHVHSSREHAIRVRRINRNRRLGLRSLLRIDVADRHGFDAMDLVAHLDPQRVRSGFGVNVRAGHNERSARSVRLGDFARRLVAVTPVNHWLGREVLRPQGRVRMRE